MRFAIGREVAIEERKKKKRKRDLAEPSFLSKSVYFLRRLSTRNDNEEEKEKKEKAGRPMSEIESMSENSGARKKKKKGGKVNVRTIVFAGFLVSRCRPA